MLIDCHNHSKHSDGSCEVSQMVNSAELKGIEVFAITDHCDLDEYEKQNLAKTVPASVEAIKKEQGTAKLKLLCGIELGQAHAYAQKATEILQEYDFDIVIGSLHALKGQVDFYWIDYGKLSDDEIYALMDKYYDEILELVIWNGFDTLAHIGYPYRYIINADRLTDDILPIHFEDKIKEIFKILIKNKKALENNTSTSQVTGQNQAINSYFLKLYKSLGGELITAGSDAHTTQNVGNKISEGYEMLKKIGFDHVVYFEKRKPVLVSI